MRNLIVLGLIALLAACDTRPEIDGERVLAIVGGTLVDGTGAAPRPTTTVVVVDGRIDRIVEDGSVRFGAGVEIVDASGKWVLPGFIDAHAHLPSRERLPSFFEDFLRAGVTAARCPATTTEYGVEIRDRLDAGELVGPRFKMAGGLIDGDGAWFDYAVVVTSPEEMRAEVALQAETGVDFVKLYSRVPPDLLAVAVSEAEARGVTTIGHLGRTSWSEAADAGIHAITHSGFLGMVEDLVPEDRRSEFQDVYMPNTEGFNPTLFAELAAEMEESVEPVRRLARQLADADVIVDPNLVLLEAMIRGDDESLYERLVPLAMRAEFEPHPATAWWYSEEREDAVAVLPHLFRAVRILHEEGVTLAAGTDVSNPWMVPGVSFHRELELLASTGIDNLEVLTIATRNGAIAMGMIDEIGTVELGKRADLVILSDDPIRDIRNSERIEQVFMDGQRMN